MRRSFVATGVVAVVLIVALAAGYLELGPGQARISGSTSAESSRESSKSLVSTSTGTTLTSTSTTSRTTTTSTQKGPIKNVNVTILKGAASNMSLAGFSPENITVVLGENNTVTWTNDDRSPHTASSTSGAFNSGNLNQGMSYTFTFTAPGTYPYSCAYHGWMHGTVVVKPSP